MQEKEKVIRVYLVYVIMVVFAIAIVGRVVFLQFFSGVELKEEVLRSTVRMVVVEAPRGNIYGDNEQKTSLALSVPRYDVYMDLVTVSEDVFNAEVSSLADSLAKVFKEMNAFQWEDKLVKARVDSSQYYSIHKNVSHVELLRLKQFPIFNLGQYKGGFIADSHTKRVRPYGQLAHRTIGYYQENTGVAVGIEGAYNHYLKGEDGEVLKERIGGGAWKPIPSEMSREAKPGADVYTSIDVNIQDVAYTALKKQMEEQDALKGCAVLMEVETGYIKAIANLTQDTAKGSFREEFNHAVGLASEPGSTFKLASLMVALDDGVIRLSDSVTMDGKYCYYGECLHDSKWGGYGKNTIQYAFEVSSNVISKIIHDNYLGKEQVFIDGLKSIGLNKKLGLDISGEAQPKIKDKNDPTFSGISIPWMSIGYEVTQTPLQTLALYNAVANGGVMVRPQLVKEIRQGDEVLESFGTEILNPAICKKSTLEDVKIMLKGVVERGTAKNISARGFEIAGKTGTAKIASGGSYSNKYQASFVGYFPADKPKYSCIVVIQGPTKNIYGSQVSGTVFKEIADKVYASGLENTNETNQELLAVAHIPFSKHGSLRELKKVCAAMNISLEDNSNGSGWVVTQTKQDKVVVKTRKLNQNEVPNVIGMGLVDALYVLESSGLTVQVVGSGIVKNQSIAPGKNLVKGQKIIIDLI